MYLSVYRKMPQVRASSGVLHADSDQVCRRTHDHFLQMLQCSVWTPVERLTPFAPASLRAPTAEELYFFAFCLIFKLKYSLSG